MRFEPLVNPAHIAWLAEHAGCRIRPEMQGIVALDKHGKIAAAVLFDEWTHTSGQIHIAIENPMVLRHRFAEEVCNYFYNSCGKLVMIGVTPSHNERALKFNRHIGFTELYRLKDGFNHGVDLVIQEMRYEDCKWIDHGQSARPSELRKTG